MAQAPPAPVLKKTGRGRLLRSRPRNIPSAYCDRFVAPEHALLSRRRIQRSPSSSGASTLCSAARGTTLGWYQQALGAPELFTSFNADRCTGLGSAAVPYASWMPIANVGIRER